MSHQTELELLQHYVSRITIHAMLANHGSIWPGWSCADEIPAYNRLYLISEGEARLGVDGRSFTAAAGDLCVLPAGRHISYARVPGRPLVKYWCHFTATVGGLELFKLVRTPGYVVPADDRARMLFDLACLHAEQSTAAATIGFQADVLALIGCFLSSFSPADVRLAAGPLQDLYPLLDFIESNLDKELNLTILAKQLHLHPKYFARYFRKLMGISPMTYIQQKRIDRAKQLLALTLLPLREVAEATGFSDLAYFSHALSKQLGMPPTEYRRFCQARETGKRE